MSVWGLFLAPLITVTPLVGLVTAMPPQIQAAADESDVFGGLSIMDESAMSAASGGEGTAIDIANLGVNIAKSSGEVSEVYTNDTETGQIAGNIIADNGGITTVLNNTGNGVVMQSTVNVNVFLNSQGN